METFARERDGKIYFTIYLHTGHLKWDAGLAKTGKKSEIHNNIVQQQTNEFHFAYATVHKLFRFYPNINAQDPFVAYK